MAETQNLKNHARYVPGYHYLLALLVAVNLVHAAKNLIAALRGQAPYSVELVYSLILAIAILIMAWYVRAFPVAVQNRVIRLEERLRVNEWAPQLAPRFDELAIGQVVALRFAGDDELAALMQQVLDGKLTKPADIKAAIRHWKADTLRA